MVQSVECPRGLPERTKRPGVVGPVAYVETPLDSGWMAPCDVRPTVLKGAIGKANLGAMRYKVRIRYQGQTVAMPGAEAVEKRGISLIRSSAYASPRTRDWWAFPMPGSTCRRFTNRHLCGIRILLKPTRLMSGSAGQIAADLMVAVLRRYTGLALRCRNSHAFYESGALGGYLHRPCSGAFTLRGAATGMPGGFRRSSGALRDSGRRFFGE